MILPYNKDTKNLYKNKKKPILINSVNKVNYELCKYMNVFKIYKVIIHKIHYK